eukprot:gene8868-18113_t
MTDHGQLLASLEEQCIATMHEVTTATDLCTLAFGLAHLTVRNEILVDSIKI